MCREIVGRQAGSPREGGRKRPAAEDAPSWPPPSSMVDLIDETRSDDVPEPEHEAPQPPASSSGRLTGLLQRLLTYFSSSRDGQPQWALGPEWAIGSDRSTTTGGGTAAREILLEDADPSPLDDCPICLQALESNVVKTPCNHKFHSAWCINGNRTHAQLYPCVYTSADSKRA